MVGLPCERVEILVQLLYIFRYSVVLYIVFFLKYNKDWKGHKHIEYQTTIIVKTRAFKTEKNAIKLDRW